jgi:hypothetical protein
LAFSAWLLKNAILVLSSILLARHRIPLTLDDQLVHEARVEYLAAKALLLQQL